MFTSQQYPSALIYEYMQLTCNRSAANLWPYQRAYNCVCTMHCKKNELWPMSISAPYGTGNIIQEFMKKKIKIIHNTFVQLQIYYNRLNNINIRILISNKMLHLSTQIYLKPIFRKWVITENTLCKQKSISTNTSYSCQILWKYSFRFNIPSLTQRYL